jgi:(1->4)-alpha-D-glucan 1-alpha-D-glucosylmutase
VYRTYIRDFDVPDADRGRIHRAIAAARRSGEAAAFDFIERVLLLEPAWYLRTQRYSYLDFVKRWQQFTGAIMAKGLEDTAFYVQNALISVNEVGGDPSGPFVYFGVEEFHRRNRIRNANWPRSMNASSTHDTKRSEDARSRINVLSELPGEWSRYLNRWRRMNPGDSAPDLNEQTLIYQSMLGAWPIDAERLKRFVTKALREAKTNTSWIHIDADYESQVMAFIDRILSSGKFMRSFLRLQKKIARFGALSSLSQLLLKITSPGIPDFYQGTETWTFNLADPDNRGPVDFALRQETLQKLKEGAAVRELLSEWADGRIKMHTCRAALTFRRRHPDLFLRGDYIPLRVLGARRDHVIAFARRFDKEWALVAVPRLLAKLGNKRWGDTRMEYPPDAPQKWINVLTNEEPDFEKFPFMLLTP